MVFAASLGSATNSDVPIGSRTYDHGSKEDRERFRSMLKESGFTGFRLCKFDQLCDAGRCEETEKYGEVAIRVLSKSEDWEDLSEVSTITGNWIGPEGRTDISGAVLGEILSGIGAGYGDRLSILSINRSTGTSRLTLHGTQELWSRTYLGICEVIE